LRTTPHLEQVPELQLAATVAIDAAIS